MIAVTGHNGVRLRVRTAGNPADPPILLVHGWSQCSLSWKRQLTAFEGRFFIVAPDLRGHGASDKPDDPAAYNTSAPWAGDIAAIIDQIGLHRPLLVGWSMGGWVVQDYIRTIGDAAISGIVLIGTSVTTGRHSPDGVALKRDSDVVAKGMYSADGSENRAATESFIRACTAAPLRPEDFAAMVEFNMMVPPHIRAAARIRHEDYRPTMRSLSVPALVVWGDKERIALPPMIAETLATIPGARPLELTGTGHAPFFEDPECFNPALADFASHCFSERAAA